MYKYRILVITFGGEKEKGQLKCSLTGLWLNKLFSHNCTIYWPPLIMAQLQPRILTELKIGITENSVDLKDVHNTLESRKPNLIHRACFYFSMAREKNNPIFIYVPRNMVKDV